MAYKRKVTEAEVRKIQDVPVGEFVQVSVKRKQPEACEHHRCASSPTCERFTLKVYKLDGWDSLSRTYYLDDMDDISRGRYVKKDTLVLVGFTY